jgi:hypothetical protein
VNDGTGLKQKLTWLGSDVAAAWNKANLITGLAILFTVISNLLLSVSIRECRSPIEMDQDGANMADEKGRGLLLTPILFYVFVVRFFIRSEWRWGSGGWGVGGGYEWAVQIWRNGPEETREGRFQATLPVTRSDFCMTIF